MGSLQGRGHRFGADLHTQRQGIDEDAQRPVGGLGALQAAHQYSAKDHVRLPGDATQDSRPGQMKQAGGTDPLLPRLSAQAHAERARQRHMAFFDAAAVALHIMQAKRQGRFIDCAEHVAKERFVFLLADAQPRLRHIVAKRHRRAQLRALTAEKSLDFMAHHVQRAVVQGHMVKQQNGDNALCAFIPGMRQMQQRRTADLQPVMTAVETRFQAVQRLFTGRRLKAFARQLRLPPDHLHRCRQALPKHCRAQDIVAIDHRLQRLGKGFQPLDTGEDKRRLHHIRIAVGGADMVVQNAFLQRRQRVNVLHIGRAARHRGDNRVDLGLLQTQQVEHRRGNARRISRDAIGRHLHRTAGAGCVLPAADQRQQRRLVFTQQRQHARLAERLFVALHQQLVILEGQLNVPGLQGRQYVIQAHRTISILSVIAA
ncbi:hypothetical protein PS3A_37620 [Pseudomonas sp. 3A(2025)]